MFVFLWRTKSHNSATSKVNIEKIERDQTSINPNTVSNFMKFGQGKFELSLEVWTDWFTIIHFRSKLGRNVHWMIFYKFYVFHWLEVHRKNKSPKCVKKVFFLSFESSSLKSLGQLKPILVGMFIGCCSKQFMFLLIGSTLFD